MTREQARQLLDLILGVENFMWRSDLPRGIGYIQPGEPGQPDYFDIRRWHEPPGAAAQRGLPSIGPTGQKPL